MGKDDKSKSEFGSRLYPCEVHIEEFAASVLYIDISVRDSELNSKGKSNPMGIVIISEGTDGFCMFKQVGEVLDMLDNGEIDMQALMKVASMVDDAKASV